MFFSSRMTVAIAAFAAVLALAAVPPSAEAAKKKEQPAAQENESRVQGENRRKLRLGV